MKNTVKYFGLILVALLLANCTNDDGGSSSSQNFYTYKEKERKIARASFEFGSNGDFYLFFEGENDGDLIKVHFGSVDISDLNGTYTFSDRYSPNFNKQIHFGGGHIENKDDDPNNYFNSLLDGTITIKSISESYIDVEFSLESNLDGGGFFATGSYKGALAER